MSINNETALDQSSNYIYLDDEDSQEVGPIIGDVTDLTKGLKIELLKPRPFAEQMEIFGQQEYDGILLDLRLDEYGDKVGYRATSLAQEIRTRAAEGAMDVPIVLWSTDARLDSSYNRDNTGHDLFDLKCVKGNISKDENYALNIGRRMISLSGGYKQISKNQRDSQNRQGEALVRSLCLLPDFVSILDPRILMPFLNNKDFIPAHELARFILCHLLEHPGPLIDIHWVAARLGISVPSSPDFVQVLDAMGATTLYSGVFNEGWQRWWATQIQEWWQNLEDCPGSLRAIPASARVKFLRKTLGIEGLVAAVPIKEQYSANFWTICQVTKLPLDPRDGFVLHSEFDHPWQERLYISAVAAFNGGVRRAGLQLDPLEIDRFRRLQQLQQKSNAS